MTPLSEEEDPSLEIKTTESIVCKYFLKPWAVQRTFATDVPLNEGLALARLIVCALLLIMHITEGTKWTHIGIMEEQSILLKIVRPLYAFKKKSDDFSSIVCQIL